MVSGVAGFVRIWSKFEKSLPTALRPKFSNVGYVKSSYFEPIVALHRLVKTVYTVSQVEVPLVGRPYPPSHSRRGLNDEAKPGH